jgi:hypothetical protein
MHLAISRVPGLDHRLGPHDHHRTSVIIIDCGMRRRKWGVAGAP